MGGGAGVGLLAKLRIRFFGTGSWAAPPRCYLARALRLKHHHQVENGGDRSIS